MNKIIHFVADKINLFTVLLLIFFSMNLIDIADGAKGGTIREMAWSPDGGKIAIIYDEGENPEVYVIKVGEEKGVNVSRTTGVEKNLAWSPNGNTLLFSSDAGKGSFDICAVEGKNNEEWEKKCLTHSDADEFSPAWRHDAEKIAYCSYEGGRYRVYTMDADGSNAVVFFEAESCYPTWSPDGKKMALAHNGDIVVVDAASGRNKNITKGLVSGHWADDLLSVRLPPEKRLFPVPPHTADGVEDTLPVWSPEKDRIAFVGRYEANLSQIYILSGSGKKLTRISDNVYEEFPPNWSPDGKHLVYSAYVPSRNPEIFISSEDGTEKRRLTVNKSVDMSPIFSPDGQKILFIRRERGRDDLYLMDVHGDGQQKLFPKGFSPEREEQDAGK
ncbi:MAG: hypothetical protein AB1546_16220 [bacterium]